MADVCEGTLKLRESGRAYLPMESAEDSREFEIRRKRAIFFQATGRTKGGLVGMVFRKEPKLLEDVPLPIRGQEEAEGQAAIEGHWENIDNAGTHGAVFAKELFDHALRDGHAVIFVDMPPPLPPGATLADEKRSGRRPYWIEYKAEQIINWRTRNVGGKTVLDLIVFRECTQESDGEYGQKEVTRYRVLRAPGAIYSNELTGAVESYATASWELFEEVEGQDNNTELIRVGGGAINLPEIPVVPIYGKRTGYLTSQPPLIDVALINLAHYQKYSDFSIYLHLCKPVLWFRGRDTNVKIEPIGPYTSFDVKENGTVEFAEPTGAALEACSADIKDLEARMAVLGLALVQGGNKEQATTATEEILDHVREDSDLATAARSLKDGLERALKFHAQYLDASATTGGSVELGATIEELALPAQELTAYSNMVAAKQLSLETLWSVMARAGKLPADFDAKKEREVIKKDAEDAMDEAMRAFERGDVGGVPGGRPPVNNNTGGGGDDAKTTQAA